MNKLSSVHNGHSEAQGSKKNTVVREIVLMFTLLGVAAALLAPLPALGEDDIQNITATANRVPLVENPVFTQVGENQAGQLPSSDGFKGDGPVKNTEGEQTAGAQKSDETSGDSTTSVDSSSGSLTSDSNSSATSASKEDGAVANGSSGTKTDTDTLSESGTKDSADSASGDKAVSGVPTNNGTSQGDTSQSQQSTDTEDKTSANSESVADKETADKDNVDDEDKDGSQADKEESSPVDADGLTVDKLPGRGPEAPFYTDPFAEQASKDIFSECTVTFSPNGGGGANVTRTTTTGNITLPTIEELGFTPPAGALFVGWSPSSSGYENVYASDVLYPDNVNHTAVLVGNTTLYAIWLMPGSAADKDTAYYFIREDGLIPFEPSSYNTSLYIPSGSNPVLTGTLNWGISITNNQEAVEANLATKPTDEEIQAAMERQGKSFDPKNQEVIWYVIKTRTNKTWNVDGVIVDKVEYLVSYNPNGGDANVPAARAYKPGEGVGVSFALTPKRPGYTFLGWSEDANATSPTYVNSGTSSFVMPDHPVTLYATWEKNTVQLTYESEDTEAGSVSNDHDDVYSLDGAPVNEGAFQGSTAHASEGYLFQGWYKSDSAGNDVLVTTDETLSEEIAVQNANRRKGIIIPTTFIARFVQAEPTFTLTKAIDNEPANGTFFAAGEEVKYTVTVVNTGNVDLENIAFKDALAQVPSIDALAVGETKSVQYGYVVTDEDTKADVLTNTVEATAHTSKLPNETVTTNPASASAFVGTLLPSETYALFAAYPVDEGTVDQSYNIINTDTGEGIQENTAQAKPGYEFEGWYKEGDDTVITTSPTLTVDEIKDHMNQGKAGRSAYGPTLFIAHFEPVASEPGNPGEGGDSGAVTPDKPEGGGSEGGDSGNTGGTTTPDTPDKPDVPDVPGSSDKPVTPDTPATPDTPGASDKPTDGSGTDSGEGDTTGGTASKPGSTGGSDSATTPNKPSGTTSDTSSENSNATTSGGSNASSTVQTPTNELGPTDVNDTVLTTPAPVTADGITPTDVPASSIKAEDIDSNTSLAQTDDYVLKVLLGVTLGGAAIAALALIIILLSRKRKDS